MHQFLLEVSVARIIMSRGHPPSFRSPFRFSPSPLPLPLPLPHLRCLCQLVPHVTSGTGHYIKKSLDQKEESRAISQFRWAVVASKFKVTPA